MPLERPTLLVLRPERDPVLLVPELERPLAAASPMGEHLELVPWRDGADPYEAAASLLSGAARVAVADRLWASHLLGLQRALPDASFSPASAVLVGSGAVKDAHELEALRRAARAADETFREILAMPFEGRSEEDVAHDLAELLVRHGHAQGGVHDRRQRPERRLPAPRAGGPDDPAPRRGRDGLRGRARGLPQRHHSDRRGRGAARGVRAGVRGRPGGPGRGRGRRPARGPRRRRSIGPPEPMIEAAGYGERFIHRTGHGIGLELHEPPYMVEGRQNRPRTGDDVLRGARRLPGGTLRDPDRGHRGRDRRTGSSA